jgi:site-specific DNA-methyltransferase (adenine-specific)
MNFDWVNYYWKELRLGGIYIVQTDYHSVLQIGKYILDFPDSELINKIAWKCEWGNHPKDRMHQCYDDILVFRKGKNTQHKFYSDRIQIDKATKTKGLNPSGRLTKTSTAFISDITLTTTAIERIRGEDGHLIRWQKPYALMQRIIDPFTDVGDYLIEPFGGTFSACRWAKANGRNAVGIELDKVVFEIGKKEVEKTKEYSEDQTIITQYSLDF